MQEQEWELLNSIYRNAEMGRDGLYFVLRKTDDTNFRKLIETQLMEYQSLMDEAEERIRAGGEEPLGSSSLSKTMVRISAGCKTKQDNSPSALADMLIQGSTMGVSKISKQISHYQTKCEDCLSLAERLRHTEENNIEQMKKYL